MSLFAIQVLTSFLAGSILITFFSMLAEKASSRIAGIIMMFPTTAAVGFFFLGYTTSGHHVAEVVPATLIPMGIVVLSSFLYIRFACFYSAYFSRALCILLSFSSISLLWLVLVLPFAWNKFSHLPAGIIGYLLLIVIAGRLFAGIKTDAGTEKIAYTKTSILLRAVFVGLIVSLVVIAGKLINPFWGGIVTMYPAATLSTLMILSIYYEPAQLYRFYRKAPLGSLSLFAYCMSVMCLYPRLGLVYGTVCAYLVSIAVSAALLMRGNTRAITVRMKHRLSALYAYYETRRKNNRDPFDR